MMTLFVIAASARNVRRHYCAYRTLTPISVNRVKDKISNKGIL
jgi:hypothetical protein